MKLSDADVLAVFRFRLAGWSVDRIAVGFNVSPSYAYDLITGRRRRSVEPMDADRIACIRAELEKAAKRARRRAAAFAMKAAVDDYQGGWSLTAASAKWGVGRSSLYRELQRWGLKRRSKAKRSRHYGKG